MAVWCYLGPVYTKFLSRDHRHFFAIEASIWTFGHSQQQMENENSEKMTMTLRGKAKIRSYFVRNNALRATKWHNSASSEQILIILSVKNLV